MAESSQKSSVDGRMADCPRNYFFDINIYADVNPDSIALYLINNMAVRYVMVTKKCSGIGRTQVYVFLELWSSWTPGPVYRLIYGFGNELKGHVFVTPSKDRESSITRVWRLCDHYYEVYKNTLNQIRWFSKKLGEELDLDAFMVYKRQHGLVDSFSSQLSVSSFFNKMNDGGAPSE